MPDTLTLYGHSICRGEKLHTLLTVPDTDIKIPMTVINGSHDGKTLLITSGIHGGEYPGVAAAMQLGSELDPRQVYGCIIILHPVNIPAFWARREFVVPEDNKNLNRVFPGKADGTLSEKIAFLISNSFFPIADFYADLHSGDIHEALHPYVYYPGQPTAEVEKIARGAALVMDMQYMVRSLATGGAYNYAASTGLPSILIERGGAGICLPEDVAAYKKDLYNLLRYLEIIPQPPVPTAHTPVDVENVLYLEAEENCCWHCAVTAGALVRKGQLLGCTTDLFGTVLEKYYAEFDGVVLYLCPGLAAPAGSPIITYGQIKAE